MDWTALAPIVSGIAPKLGAALGTAVGGPLGGIAGSVIGTGIAAALGVDPTPEAVAAKISNDPKAAARLEKLENEHADALIQQAQVAIAEAEQRGLTDRTNIEQVNETARAELGSVSWWHWRHLMGYAVLAQGTAIPFAILIFGLKGNAEATKGAIDTATALSMYFLTMAGLLGYVAQDTTRGKIVAATGQAAPTMTDGALGAVKNLVSKVRGR